MEVTVPYNWAPRDYQEKAWFSLEDGKRFGALVWHRRAGKDLFGINWTARELCRRPGLYWHMLPTQNQGRKVVWDGGTRENRRFLDHFPGYTEYITAKAAKKKVETFVTRDRDDQMKLWFANGAQWQVVGADEPDALLGANPFGIIFSEWSVFKYPDVWDKMRPILEENGGWALFIYTPRGRNHGYKRLKDAQRSDRWFAEVLGINDTGAIKAERVDEMVADGDITRAFADQEFHCSFDAPLEGAYWGDVLTRALNEGRIGRIPHDPHGQVHTFWDIGMRDATAVWFYQQLGWEHRLIDFYYSAEVGLDHYVNMLADKRAARGFVYGEHLMPHDMMVREFAAPDGRTRLESLRQLGVIARVVPKGDVSEGINATREFLAMALIDEKHCESGLDGLRQYTRMVIEGVQAPDGGPVYSDKPAKSWACHPADALRTGIMGRRISRPDNSGVLGRRPEDRVRESLAPKISMV